MLFCKYAHKVSLDIAYALLARYSCAILINFDFEQLMLGNVAVNVTYQTLLPPLRTLFFQARVNFPLSICRIEQINTWMMAIVTSSYIVGYFNKFSQI